MDNDLTLIFDSIQEQGLPSHYRTVTGPWKTAVDSPPSRQGLGELRASGSEQPSPSELASVIRGLAPKVTVVDLRQESHALLGEHPVSWYGLKNWANDGKSLAEVEADETARIRALPASGTATVSRVFAKDFEGGLSEVRVEQTAYDRVRSEADAARELGLGSFRIAVRDHSSPSVEDVDRFIVFVRNLAPDTWLHFHCHAGDGRTTTFLLVYDMLHNAKAFGLEELAARQHLIGGIDLLHMQHTGWKEVLYKERAAFIGRFYRYASSRDFKTMLWSEFLATG